MNVAYYTLAFDNALDEVTASRRRILPAAVFAPTGAAGATAAGDRQSTDDHRCHEKPRSWVAHPSNP